jgi:hypothetical protein
MMIAEVVGMEGVGEEVSGMIRLWKSVEKSKLHPKTTNVSTRGSDSDFDGREAYRNLGNLFAVGDAVFDVKASRDAYTVVLEVQARHASHRSGDRRSRIGCRKAESH